MFDSIMLMNIYFIVFISYTDECLRLINIVYLLCGVLMHYLYHVAL